MFVYSSQTTEAYLEPNRTFTKDFFCENSKSLTIFVKAFHHRICLRDIAQSLFRTQLNIYDRTFLQKKLTAKNRSKFLQNFCIIAHDLCRTHANVCNGGFFQKIVNAKKSLTVVTKMLLRLLIGFLNTSLGNTVQKTSKIGQFLWTS